MNRLPRGWMLLQDLHVIPIRCEAAGCMQSRGSRSDNDDISQIALPITLFIPSADGLYPAFPIPGKGAYFLSLPPRASHRPIKLI